MRRIVGVAVALVVLVIAYWGWALAGAAQTPGWVSLWFQKSDRSITAVFVNIEEGKIYEKAIAAPQSTLEYLQLEPEEVQQLFRIPAFPITTSQLSKYNLQFLGTEKVDEVDCYIFQASPKTLDRQHPYFDGIMWVDQKYLEVVKTYGKWITDLGEVHPPTLPFAMFETYRENVEGKYWFPNYSRSESFVKLKEREVPVRFTVKWTNFKPFPAIGTPSPTLAAPTAKDPAKP